MAAKTTSRSGVDLMWWLFASSFLIWPILRYIGPFPTTL